jgi:hypothetical protein
MTVTLPAGAYRDHEVETPSRYLSSEEAEVMKRESALIPLSQDHHVALFVAQRLRRAAPATINEARAAFLTYWNEHGRDHFSLEEELLLPAYAEYGDPHHRVVARVLCDHVDIRHRAKQLGVDLSPTVGSLHELGARLSDHVRLEERELFPLIERAMPAKALAALADVLATAGDVGGDRRSARLSFLQSPAAAPFVGVRRTLPASDTPAPAPHRETRRGQGQDRANRS